MTPWPAHVQQAFEHPDAATDAAGYYGPYNVLLNHLFPASQGYQVAPMPQSDTGSTPSLLFAVKKHHIAVLFVDVCAPDAAPSTPAPRVQEAVGAMAHALCKNPYKVTGVSTFGPRYVVYEYEYDAAANELDARAGVPALIEQGERERDVRTEDGAERWKELARSVGAVVTEA